MRYLIFLALLLPSSALAQSFGSERAGTSGFQMLLIPPDARSAAMGETVVANVNDASALFWNPALAAQLGGPNVLVSQTQYFVDTRVDYGALTFPVRRIGMTIGVSAQLFTSGDMDETTELQAAGTGRSFSYDEFAAGLTIAQQLSDLFSYGVTAKYLRSSTLDVTAETGVVDLGVFYRVGSTGAQIAVAIRNFGVDTNPSGSVTRETLNGTVTEDDFESITPPTTFLLGITYDGSRLLADRMGKQSGLQLSAQLTNPNDNAEQLSLGAELTLVGALILRSGYRFGVEEQVLPSLGAGLRLPLPGARSARFDYGFTRLDRLGDVHRISLNLGL